MNSPASSLWNKMSPAIRPNKSRKAQHIKPSEKHKKVTFFIIDRISFRLFNVWISVTVGRSTVETALVIAEGKSIQGSAIPVSTPYVLRDLFTENPKACNCKGMETASILCNKLRRTRLQVNGNDRSRISFV